MKKLWKVMIIAGCFTSPALAANGPLGLGVILGEPTGLSGKYWIDAQRKAAVDVGAAWSLSGDNDFHLHGDYLFHNYSILQDALQVRTGKLPLYFGVGARVQFRENRDDKVGIRIPVGLSYLVEGAPLELFGELAPVVDVAPDT